MKRITLRVSDTEYNLIATKAQKNKMSITDCLVSSAIPNIRANSLTLDNVIDKIQDLNSGEKFNLPDLFTDAEWTSFTTGSRISTGRKFYSALTKNDYNLMSIVKFLGKDSSNLAQYVRL